MEGIMQCPKCQFENPEDSSFCLECGHKLEILCPQCDNALPPTAKFCNKCGHNLTQPSEPILKELSFDEKLEKIQKYLPGGLTEKILSQRGKIEGERKQVTVMFADMEGFTPLVEKLGPEEAYTIMDEIYEILIHKVHEYEGTVNEMTGDGIMALFGAPIALEDAPQRAIRSALAIHREMSRFSDKIRKERKGIASLKMRIGIHSGPVVVGTLGNNLRVEFKAVGDTVNLASRMEGLAEPGTTYVTEDLFKLTEGLFRFEALGEKPVKGKEDPLRVFQVIAPTTRRTRFDVSAERGLTSFVGRDRELELLLDSLERAKDGSGQAFSIIGEAGIGKSRFLYEFRKAVSNEDITFLEGKCLSFSRGVPYHPIIDVLRGNFDITEEDTDDGVRNKVRRSLEILKAEEAGTLPFLLEVLEVEDSGIDSIRMSPEGRKDRIIEAVKEIILKGALVRPLVIAIEDLHWADKSTEDALRWLLEAVPGARVLILFTYRPEFVHTWGGRSYHNQITLNRLSNRETLLMVSHILGTGALEPDLQRLILGKTEGVPFFIEEFVKSLQGLEVIKREDGKVVLQGDPQAHTIPSTIQDTIMARVDQLSDGARGVLQAGSAIEREFPHDLISTVTGLPEEELLRHLSSLKDAELIYERGIYPRNSYIFRHALTREVVLASVLEQKRRELHGRIGTAIEDNHKGDLSEHYEILSEHFYRSNDYLKAAEYAKRSARKAQKRGFYPDAIAHTKMRVSCLERLSDPDDRSRERIDARTTMGLYFTEINHHVEAKEAVEPVLRLAKEKMYMRRLAQIQTVIGSYYLYVEEDFPSALEALEEALHIAANEKDFLTLLLASFWSGNLHAYECDFEKAREALQRALDISEAAKNLSGIATMKAHLAWLCYYWPGRINQLMGLSSEALQIAQQSGENMPRGQSHATYGYACYAKGRFEEAEKNLLEGAHFCERVSLYSWEGAAWSGLAQVYFEMKKYEKSRECFDQAIRCYQRINFNPSWARWANLGMTMCGIILGEKDVNLDSLRAIVKDNRIKLAEGYTCRYLGETLLNLGGRHITEAEEWIRSSINTDTRNGLKFFLGLDHVLYGKFFKRQGDRTKEQEEIGKSIEIFQECGADGWVEKYEKELAEIS
jgi:class 3 adenylate cyclase/tetratricopeptide (TPR) repeat protein